MERIWLKSYDPGVPAEIDEPPHLSLRDMMEHSFSEYAELPAFTNMGLTMTYSDIDRESLKFASYLQNELGLTRGERVALMMPNILQYPVALAGIFRAGLVAVNVNPLYTARELKHQLNDSGSKAILIFETFAKTLEEIIDDTEVENVITTGVGDLLGLKGSFLNFMLRYVKKAVPKCSFEKVATFNEALSKGAGKELKRVELGLADIAFLQYTGGTTGVSKGAMLSHRNLVNNVEQTVQWQAGIFDDIDQVVAICALPLYHIFSLQGNLLVGMEQGSHNILITNPRDFPAFVKELGNHKFGLFNGVNTLFATIMNTPGFADLDFSNLRVVVGGGTAVQPAVAKQWKEMTNSDIVQGYGLTETSPACICNRTHAEFGGSIGLPLPSTDAMIAGDDGNPLPQGEIGEICIKGPQVMEGYWQRPKETSDTMLPGGWLRTGDIGRMDEDGYFFIEDRKKDMIIVSGFNVYPNEVENVIVEVEGILEAAAIGVPSEKSGESVKVFAVRTDENVTEQDVMDYCKENLTGYKRPREVVFLEELPKTNVGKILRRELRDL